MSTTSCRLSKMCSEWRRSRGNFRATSPTAFRNLISPPKSKSVENLRQLSHSKLLEFVLDAMVANSLCVSANWDNPSAMKPPRTIMRRIKKCHRSSRPFSLQIVSEVKSVENVPDKFSLSCILLEFGHRVLIRIAVRGWADVWKMRRRSCNEQSTK